MNNYSVGVYIRLSKEDYFKNGNNSESVINQRDLLLKYVKDMNLSLYDVYIDDGYSGTNFERPAFNKMISDIENKLINMVIVKDLSRLGRDYVITGYYLDFYFPKNGIRFVSILDGIDSFKDNSSNDMIPFKSIINDLYSRDNSRKIKAALYIKQKQGKWVGGCPPFGYKVDPLDKNHLVIEMKEAKIVKKIYSLFWRGLSINEISSFLTTNEVPTPNVLRNKNNNNIKWNTTTIKNILCNQLYTGDMIQNRRSRISYKIKKLKNNSIDDWIIVQNTHEAIIDKRVFFSINKRIKEMGKMTTNKENNYLLSCMCICGECGHRIVIQKSGKYNYLVCNNYKKNSKLDVCSFHYIDYEQMEQKIITAVRYLLSFINIESIIDKCKKSLFDCQNVDLFVHNVVEKIDINILRLLINNIRIYKDKSIALFLKFII